MNIKLLTMMGTPKRSSFSICLQTFLRLGIGSLILYSLYRLSLLIPISRTRNINSRISEGPLFEINDKTNDNEEKLKAKISANLIYYGWFQPTCQFNDIPKWDSDCMTGETTNSLQKPWWTIPDFSSLNCDIKNIWEPSRFEWIVQLAQLHLSGDKESGSRLNAWANDWIISNPPYYGPNWKCGQEASIRLLNTILTSLLLNQHLKPTKTMADFVIAHLKRIKITSGYALAQKNNHAISESSALYIGGIWLERNGFKIGSKYHRLGEKRLVALSNKLIAPDGSFSQHSTNYHRMIIALYSMSEHWRRLMSMKPFPPKLISRITLAIEWLQTMTQPETGCAPNIGGNDGTNLFNLSQSHYRDMRPILQLASVIFLNKKTFEQHGQWNDMLLWLNRKLPEGTILPSKSNKIFPHGGYVILRKEDRFVLLNTPTNKFRPSQSDALHLDFWIKGKPFLVDSGTYSYNGPRQLADYFSSPRGHNTVQFDDRDQMPKIKRFLYGAWLSTKEIEPIVENSEGLSSGANYTDYLGATHSRKITINNSTLTVYDNVTGFKNHATLRWRLMGNDWTLNDNKVESSIGKLTVITSSNTFDVSLVEGWESSRYWEKKPVQVLEVTIKTHGTFTTKIESFL